MQSDIFSGLTDFGGVSVNIKSNRYACLEGCEGIVSYSDGEIVVRAKKLRIELLGRNLKIAFFGPGGIVVEGVINSVNYTYGR